MTEATVVPSATSWNHSQAFRTVKRINDYAPEPLLLLWPSLKAGIDEWHLEGL